MADRIAVMDGGRLMQYSSPDEVYRRPANTTVARFVGSPSMNLIGGTVGQSANGWVFQSPTFSIALDEGLAAAARGQKGGVTIGVRAEGLEIGTDGLPLRGNAQVYAVEPLGSDQYIDISFGAANGAEPTVLKLRTRPNVRARVGETIAVSALPTELYMFNAAGARIFPTEASQ